MNIIICPGVHELELTQSFIEGLLGQFSISNIRQNIVVFPAENYPAYSAFHIWQFLRDANLAYSQPVIFISFSAGVVGAIAAAWMWQSQGGRVKAFIAIDGWGVPLGGDFPIHRLSHDYFTHWSSALLGGGEESFWADPAVGHLQIWSQPQSVVGWWTRCDRAKSERPTRSTAAQFLTMLIERYLGELPTLPCG
jgi:hypothetical protein